MSVDEFRHEALFYAGEDEFLAGTLPFIRAGVAAGEPLLVAVSEAKAERLRSQLNSEAANVCFVDIAEVGRNPACIIPVWRGFVTEHAAGDRLVRGIGEPVWPGRSPPELVECQHHESLLNLAFEGGPPWWLLCPYDVGTLAPEVVEAARCTHPIVAEHGAGRPSPDYLEPQRAPGPFEGPLPAPSRAPAELSFTGRELGRVRTFVTEHALLAGLGAERTADLVLAVNVIA